MSTPGQRFALSPQRKLNRTLTSRIALILSAPAFALAAVAAPAGWSATAAAQPVSSAHTIAAAAPANLIKLASSGSTASRPRHRLGRNEVIAWHMLHRFGWRPRYQFRYLRRLWNRESSWNVHAANPYSGAYGIPQAVPGSKMATAGPNWRTSARTQIRWGLRYIRSRYGSPARAWGHECGFGWY